MASLAPGLGIDPLMLVVPAAISASCAFMLPVATPPNAVAAEMGQVSSVDMARAGWVLNLVLAVWAAVLGAYWAPVVL